MQALSCFNPGQWSQWMVFLKLLILHSEMTMKASMVTMIQWQWCQWWQWYDFLTDSDSPPALNCEGCCSLVFAWGCFLYYFSNCYDDDGDGNHAATLGYKGLHWVDEIFSQTHSPPATLIVENSTSVRGFAALILVSLTWLASKYYIFII